MANDVVFPNGPDLDGLQRVLVGAGVDARSVPGGLVLAGGQATIEAGAIVFRATFAPDLLTADQAHEGDNALNLQLATARALHLQGALALDHMVRADSGIARETLLAALRAFMRDVDAIAGRPVAAESPPAPDGMDVPAVVAALAGGGVAAQSDPEPGFVVAEHEGIRLLVDLTHPSRATFAAYFQPPQGGPDRVARLAFANYMNGRYMLGRTKLDGEARLVVDYPLVRSAGFVPASFVSTVRLFATVALRVRQAVENGWVHTPLPS